MSTNLVAEVGSTANNYQVLAKLAVGGMAEIFLARGASAAGVERYVVLKRILRDKANDTHFVGMFLEEARLAAQLQHPNVAQVYDIGKLGDSYFFTMEYVHGETVRSMLHQAYSQQREIPLACILSVIAGTAAGLHHAHERIGVDGRPLGIVHRDVSPSNLMVSYEGNVKVVDFGVAKAENRATETRSGTVKGKISYLSPEQCRGAPVDRRSDLFSLGIVLWEMLTADRLYKRGSDFEIMTAIVTESPPPPSLLRRDLPHQLDALTMRLLAKNPADRFQSGDDVVEAVEQVAAALSQQLSQKALGRYMRELFGTRKEPWVEIEQQKPEGVTVTSEPIPADIAAGMSRVDMQLDGLADLSVRVPYSESSVPMRPSMERQAQSGPKLSMTMAARPAVMAKPGALPAGIMSQQLTVNQLPPTRDGDDYPTVALITDRDRHSTERDVLATVPTMPTPPYRHGTESSSPAMPPMLAPIARGSQSSPPPMSGPPVGTPPLPSTLVGYQQPAPAVHPSVPLPLPLSQMQSGSHPFPPRYHTPSTPPEVTAVTARSSNATLFAAVGAGAVVLAVVAFVAMRKGKTVGGDASTETAPKMVMTPAGEIDAGTVVEAVVVDAPTPTVAAGPDAAENATETPVSKAEQAERAFAEERYADVVTACKVASSSELAPSCTIAACKTGDGKSAKSWFARVSSGKRSTVVAACKAAGVELTGARIRPPTTKTDPKDKTGGCSKDVDPMSCQH